MTPPPGHGPDGGASGRAAGLGGAGEGASAGRRGPELRVPPADRAVQGLPGQKQRGPHHLQIFLRAAGESGEAAARRESGVWAGSDRF